MRKKLSSWIQRPAAPFVLLWVMTFFLHLVMNMYSSDDVVMRALTYESLFDFMVERYLTWSTRIFTDSIFMVLLHQPTIVWRLLDTTVFTLFGYVLAYLAYGARDVRLNLITVCLFLLYPFVDMVSAGWIVTTCVYLWSAAAISFALVPLKRLLEGKNASVLWSICGIVFALLAGSQEQACCSLIAFTGLVVIYAFIKKKLRPLMIVELAIGLLMLCVHLLSPALPLRDVAEAQGWFGDFAETTFFQRVEMGFSGTMYHYLMEPSTIFLVFSAVLFSRVLQRKQNPFVVLCAGFPLFVSIVFGFGFGFESLNAAFPPIGAIRTALGHYGTHPVWGDWDSFLPVLLLIAIAIFLLIALCHAFERPEDGWLAIYILLVGTAVRMVLGFSPTVWASGYRTFIILSFVFIYLTILFVREMARERRRFPVYFLPPLITVALFQFVTTLLATNAIGQ